RRPSTRRGHSLTQAGAGTLPTVQPRGSTSLANSRETHPRSWHQRVGRIPGEPSPCPLERNETHADTARSSLLVLAEARALQRLPVPQGTKSDRRGEVQTS